MGKAVFIHTHPFYVDNNNNVYTSGTLDKSIWPRYTAVFGDLTVIGRGRIINEKNHNYNLSSVDNVNFDLLYEIKGGIDYYKYRKKIIKKIEQYICSADYIILRMPSNFGVIAANICKKYNKKYLVEVVGSAFDSMYYFGNLTGKLIAPLSHINNKRSIKGAAAAVYVTRGYLQDNYPNPNKSINVSDVIIESFSEDVLNNHKKNIQRKSATKIIGTIGNISLPYKGYEVLFKALKDISFDFELQIVGGGDSKWITNIISKYGLSDNVILRGRLNERHEIFEFLDHLDLYVQPSLTEGLPRTVIEAMARACPIIGSDAGGIPELIDGTVIYRKNDHKRLKYLINSVLSSEDKLLNLSENNFNEAKKYTNENLNKRRFDFFNSIKEDIKN